MDVLEISEDLLAQFADYGVTVVGISGDISNGEDAQRMVAEAMESLKVLMFWPTTLYYKHIS